MTATAIDSFVANVGNDFIPAPEDKVIDSLMAQYERVVIQSLITSFGLDAFIQDRLGGDVDTIHNVRQGEAGGGYKNPQNAKDYENRGEYDSAKYHGAPGYRAENKMYSEQRKSGTLTDAYTGKSIAPNERYDLDHVIAAKRIHDDPGRILAELKGEDLANDPGNLKPTTSRTNRSKKADDMSTFHSRRGDEYTEEEKQRMLEVEQTSWNSYDAKVNRAYYTSPKFWKDTGIAAVSSSVQMGLRQVCGLIMTEVWFAVKELLDLGYSFKENMEAIARGIKLGFERAKKKFKALLVKLGEGAVSGILSSLMTTLCNIFWGCPR